MNTLKKTYFLNRLVVVLHTLNPNRNIDKYGLFFIGSPNFKLLNIT